MSGSHPNAAKGFRWIFFGEILSILTALLILVPYLPMITSIAAAVLQLLGLYTAANDDQGFRPAFYAVIVQLVVNVISGFVGAGVLSLLLDIVNVILSLFVVYQVCTTANRLLSDRALVQRGQLVIKIYLVCTVVNVVCSVLSIIPVLNVIAGLVSVVSAIASLVGYILFLMYLWGASKTLA